VHIQRLGPDQAAQVDIELLNKLTPITLNQRFGVSDQGGLPPKNSDVREVRSVYDAPLVVGLKFARSAVERP